eukprot:115588_1
MLHCARIKLQVFCITSNMDQSNLVESEMWNNLPIPGSCLFQPKLMMIDNFIWIATNYDDAEGGLIKYCPKSNTMKIIKYPQSLRPKWHSATQYGSSIYIVNGVDGYIMEYNTITQTFTINMQTQVIGKHTQCVAYNGYLYIFGGRKNAYYSYLIYCIKDCKLFAVMDPIIPHRKAANRCCILFRNRLMVFGGFDIKTADRFDTFYESSCLDDNPINIQWKINSTFKLKKGLNCFGCIVSDPYIVIFGGNTGQQRVDSISVLNVDNNVGWIELKHIKCPKALRCRAIMDSEYNIHLFGYLVQMHSAIPFSIICLNQDENDKKVMTILNQYVHSEISIVVLQMLLGSSFKNI